MVVGSGQIANIFNKAVFDDTVIFASGVSNSNCTDIREFQREKNLLNLYIKKFPEKKIVYFSSCALSAEEYEKNIYYQHKENMEDFIFSHSKEYIIFRVPQLFGSLMQHSTLINFLYSKLIKEEKFTVYTKAYRYVIFIDDLFTLSMYFIQKHKNLIIDIANPYKYSIYEIISAIEKITKKKAIYQIVEKEDQYDLDVSQLNMYLRQDNINVDFGKDYLYKKLQIAKMRSDLTS